MIDEYDRLECWTLVKNTDLSQRQLIPSLRDLRLPIEADSRGKPYTSKSEFRQLLIEVAAAEKEAIQ